LITLYVEIMKPEQQNSEDSFSALRKEEYARLDRAGHVYLDYTAANIYPQSLVEKHYRFLQEAVYGNPHSTNPASQLSGKLVSEVRKKVLEFFNAPDHYCVFTPNASGALQIVGECYPFSRDSHFLLTADNHNSVNGIREYCHTRGGSFSYAGMNCDDLSIREDELNKELCAYNDKTNKLFAYPAQSNASGVCHSLEWIKKAQQQGWDVLLDAAAFVPTSRLDISLTNPDFVSISFYKMFGYPTGIGCLLIKKEKFHQLVKPWFAGGTVSLAAVGHRGHFLLPGHERFENGTINFLDIPAISNGIDFISRIGIENIHTRIKELCRFIIPQLVSLQHDNGLPLIKIYGSTGSENRGGTFLLNFFDERSQLYPFHYIEQLANEEMISLRTGCFCNPGIDELNNDISANELSAYFNSRRQGDYDDMRNFLGKRRGAVRVSVGLPTTEADIERFLCFARRLLNVKVPKEALMASWLREIVV
jgi:molybdenum cofactor sulfurtransferase